MTTEIRLTLPVPPSVNCAYANSSRGRHKTAKAKQWTLDAEKALREQKKYRIVGDEWLEISYKFYFPLFNKGNGKKKVKDLENYFKLLSDFLGDNIEGFDDHKIKRFSDCEKMDSERNEVEIIVREIKE